MTVQEVGEKLRILLRKNFIWIIGLLCLLGMIGGLIEARKSGTQVPLTFHAQAEDGSACEEASATCYVSDAVELTAGSYRIVVGTSLSDDLTSVIEVQAIDGGYHAVLSNVTPLYAGKAQAIYDVSIRRDTTVQVTILRGATAQMTIGESYFAQSAQRGYLWILLSGLILLTAGVLYRHRGRVVLLWQKRSVRFTAIGLIAICVLVSLPLSVDYLWTGADETFHLLRIEGIKDGLLDGQFPVRMQPNWLQGYGYAVGFFYCDLFLYLPALLRLFGVSVQAAYQIYKVAINIGTVLIAFYSFYKMLRSRRIALLGALLYATSMFRIIYLYSVDGVGQYTAVMFLPLVCYGFWEILAPERVEPVHGHGSNPMGPDGEWNKLRDLRYLPLALGMSGIIESHVLTCLMVVIFGSLLCLICLIRAFRKDVIVNLVKSVVCFAGLNAWYLIPMADYSRSHEFAVLEGAATLKQIQTFGMYFSQLFAFFPSGGLYGAYPMEMGANGEIAYSIGIGLTLGLVAALFLLLIRRELVSVLPRAERISFGMVTCLGILALVMSSIHFPWDKLAKTGDLMRQLIATLQFPNRFVALAEVLLTLSALYVIRILWESRKKAGIALAILMAAGAVITTQHYMDTQQQKADFFRIYDETCMGNGYISGAEYVLLGTDTSKLTYGNYAAGEGVVITQAETQGTHVNAVVENPSGEDSYIEVPLLYYKGYQAKTAQGDALTVGIGDNNVLRISIPAGYVGEVSVRFCDRVLWRCSEIVSVLSLAAILYLANTCKSGKICRRKRP